MNKLRITFIFFILCLPSLLAARAPTLIIGEHFEERAGKGMEIHTNPAGVKVFINGIERGLTPVSFDEILPDEYSIRLTRDDYETQEFNITVHSHSRLFIAIEMKRMQGQASISVFMEQEGSEPLLFEPQLFTRAANNNAAITLCSDNKAQLNLHTGYHTITIRAFGWEDSSVTLLIEHNAVVTADIYMKPAVFRLQNLTQRRERLNPLNAGNLGITEYRFEVSAPGEGFIKILDSNGTTVYTRQLNQFNTWIQRETWNGRDTYGNLLPQGYYTVVIEAESLSLQLETEINYSQSIFPQSLESSIAGLSFAPLPHVLPPGSYQFDAGIQYDSSAFPFKINMRVSPYNRLELTTFFNINPSIKNQTGWGVSGSIKYNFTDGTGSIPLAFSAGVSYAWANENGEYPLSPGRGAGLYVPVSLELKSFSFVFCPALFWRGPQGLTPELFLSAGILYRDNWFNAGISARFELDFSDDKIKLFAGAEARFYPPPSNFVFSCQAGLRKINESLSFFGGLGIGVIY